MTTVGIKIWKSVEIGTDPRSTNKVCLSLETKGRVISRTANAILNKMIFAGEKTKVDLIKMSIHDLGFDGFDEARYMDALSRSRNLNLVPCQVEAIAKVCLQDIEQTDEWYLVAMEPVKSDNHIGHLCVLRILWKDGVLWLGTASFPPDGVMPTDTTLIFQAL